jgi:hypothetical protein
VEIGKIELALQFRVGNEPPQKLVDMISLDALSGSILHSDNNMIVDDVAGLLLELDFAFGDDDKPRIWIVTTSQNELALQPHKRTDRLVCVHAHVLILI